jgi:preprotein translocase SecE subunit
MARDRKRARQRRERRPGPEHRPGDARRDARATDDLDEATGLDGDARLDGDDAIDSPLGAGTAAPSPLDHASAYRDEARIAESGPPTRDDLDDAMVQAEPTPESERARDRLPEDDDETADEAGELALSGSTSAGAARPRRSGPFAFFGHCVDELRRVQWPTRKYVGQATAVVLGFVVIAGGYLGLLDALLKPLVKAIL